MNASLPQWQQLTDDLPADVNAAIKLLSQYKSDTPENHTDSTPLAFSSQHPLVAARAPGRLDVMGGIADYSGSEVLQMPTSEAAIVVAQRCEAALIQASSVSTDGKHTRPVFIAALQDITGGKTGENINLQDVHAFFKRHPQGDWAAYMAGVIPVLLKHLDIELQGGVKLFVVSSVPEGKGVSSSAAIEVACMRALLTLLNKELDASALAIECQKVENIVVGAPCGLMDQMSSSAGKAGELMSLLCQPATLNPSVKLPEHLSVWGIDSGIRHAVTGASYGAVRIGAFMGYRMLLEQAGLAAPGTNSDSIRDSRWGGFLANVTPAEWTMEFAEKIPESLSGKEFLERYESWSDPVSLPDPDVIYRVRNPTAHPVFEHFRVRLFKQLAAINSIEAAQLMGECMYQSHASYSACELGSHGTDTLVHRLRDLGKEHGIYGARITGGGSGGTVAILADRQADHTIRELAARYAMEMGCGGHVFHGSSDGATAWYIT